MFTSRVSGLLDPERRSSETQRSCESLSSLPHLVVAGEQIKVPLDLRRRGACGLANSPDVAALHLGHVPWSDHHFGHHCKKNSRTNQLSSTLHRPVCFGILQFFSFSFFGFLNIEYQY